MLRRPYYRTAAMLAAMHYVLAVLAFVSMGASADTIYLCKGYGGGMFWSSSTCSQNKALIDRIATVPDGLPFNQQVDIARAQRDAASAAISPATQAPTSQAQCAALKAERDKIWSRYTNWQFQPPEVVGPDRQRTLGIQAEQRRLGCPTQ